MSDTHMSTSSPDQPMAISGYLHVSEQVTRPMGKGYRDIIAFLAPYLMATQGEAEYTPTLETSLRRVLASPGIITGLQRLPCNASILIQGYSAPGNSEALRIFLHEIGVDLPKLKIVDLYNVQEIYLALGIPLPDAEFHIADATSLPSGFHDGCSDLVVQDFLLNCLPPKYHMNLLQETARILSPSGLAMIHFTDTSAVRDLRQWSLQEISDTFGVIWDSTAYQLSDFVTAPLLAEKIFTRLKGSVVANAENGQFTYLTPFDGHFEFFSTAERIIDLIDSTELKLIYTDVSTGPDNNGLHCCRHRCLVGKVPILC